MLKKEYINNGTTCKVTFSLAKKEFTPTGQIRVLGDFNNWQWENAEVLEEVGDAFETSIEVAAGKKYEFRYFMENHTWFNDLEADDYVYAPYMGVHNCIVSTVAPASEEKSEPITEEVVEETVELAAKPAKKPAKPKRKTTRRSKKDNLKKIEGIGPKIEKLLKDKGIDTFKALAEADQRVLKETLREAGSRFNRHDPTTWPEQAALAAAGEWDKLAGLQEELKGGRRK